MKNLFILIHWKDTHLLERLVRQLLQINGFDLVIINNGSKSLDQYDDIPNVTIERNGKNNGFGGAINLGIRFAIKQDYQYVCWLNNDVGFNNEDFLKALENNKVDAFGPVLNERGTMTYGGLDIAKNINTRITTKGIKPDYLPGTFFCIKGTTLKELGELDERYFFGGEMAEFCFRMKQSERSINVDEHFVVNHDSHSSVLKVYYNWRNRFLFINDCHKNNFFLKLKWSFYILYRFILFLVSAKPKYAKVAWLSLLHGNFGRWGQSISIQEMKN